MTDSQLRALLHDDPPAGERALFDAYYSYVYAIASRRILPLGTREDVEECVIDVFLEIFQRIDSIQTPHLKAYIGTTANHKAANVCRSLSAHARKTSPDGEEALGSLPDTAADIVAQTEQSERARILLDAIEALGEPDASILIQKFYYRRSAPDIARVLQMTPGNVRNRCARALKRLKPALSDLL